MDTQTDKERKGTEMAKVTKRQMFVMLDEAVASTNLPDSEKVALSDFIAREIALLDKKASKPSKPTKAQQENAALKVRIATVCEVTPLRATEIASALGVSVQKVTALTTQMVKSGTLTREVGEKKVVRFSLT